MEKYKKGELDEQKVKFAMDLDNMMIDKLMYEDDNEVFVSPPGEGLDPPGQEDGSHSDDVASLRE